LVMLIRVNLLKVKLTHQSGNFSLIDIFVVVKER
jgi:hypothetical protein